jgi:hypothetical protein
MPAANPALCIFSAYQEARLLIPATYHDGQSPVLKQSGSTGRDVSKACATTCFVVEMHQSVLDLLCLLGTLQRENALSFSAPCLLMSTYQCEVILLESASNEGRLPTYVIR